MPAYLIVKVIYSAASTGRCTSTCAIVKHDKCKEKILRVLPSCMEIEIVVCAIFENG